MCRDTSLEAMALLIDRVRNIPLLIVLTHRPEFQPKWGSHGHVTGLNLSKLTRAQSSAIVSKLTSAKALPGDLLEQILIKTDGVPLYVEELTKSILESGELRDTGDHYDYAGAARTVTIPATLRDSLMARLDRSPAGKEIAQIGAAIGREFSYELIAAVVPHTQSNLDSALNQLTESGLAFRRGTPPEAIYTFKHALVQDAAYDSLLKTKRQQLHSHIAQVLEKAFPERVANEPELLAHHYTQAGNLAEAIPLWRKAGELAMAGVVLQEAVGHCQKGLALIERLPSSSERDGLELSIREPLNAAWIGLRGWAALEVRGNATAILQLAKTQGNPQRLLIGLWGMWINTLCQGRIEETLEWAQRLLAEGDEAADIDLQIFGHAAAMVSRFFLGQLLEAQEHGDPVLALYDLQRAERWRQLTAQDFKTQVGVFSSHWIWMLGYPDQAVQASDQKDAHARRVGHTFNLSWALTWGAYAFDYRCEPERLLERASEADRLGREQSVPFINQVQVPQIEGLARLRSGQLSESISLLRRAIENWNKLGGHVRIPYNKSALAEALALQGDLDSALHLIDECLEQIERPGWQEWVHLAEVLRLKGWMLSVKGDLEGAEKNYLASLDWARQQHAKSWELRTSTSLARLWQSQGKRKEAYELLAPVYNWFTEGFDTKDLKEAKALLDELRT